MINETRTFDDFGYISDSLTRGSHKKVCVICEKCGSERVITYYNYSKTQGRCHSCTHSNPSNETRKKISIAQSGKNNSNYGNHTSPSNETRKKMSLAHSNPSDETRKKLSASGQGIEYDEWESYAKEKQYCPKFNESCRESNREKYNRECFICGKPEENNITKTGKPRKLSIHHVDMNKNQGCDGHEWKLIPVCMKCHGGSHNTKIESCIEYILSCGV